MFEDTKGKWRLGCMALPALVLTAACGQTADKEPLDDVGPATLLPKGEAPPQTFVGPKGRLYTLRGKAKFKVVSFGEYASRKSVEVVASDAERPAAPKKQSLQELAEGLRNLTVRGEYEYISEPDFEGANKILAQREEEEAEGEKPEQEGRWCCGTDDRRKETNTSAIQRPTAFVEVGCSGVMISPSVLATAAHCLYDTAANAWLQVTAEPGWTFGTPRWPRWVHAIDGASTTNPTPFYWSQYAQTYYVTKSGSTYTTHTPGAYFNCYSPNVNANYQSASSYSNGIEHDYAFVDFFESCGQKPGSTTGWWTPTIRTTTELTTTTTVLIGYPQKQKDNASMLDASMDWKYENLWGTLAGGPWYEAQLFADSGSVTINSGATWQLRYTDIDMSGGDSGSGLYQTVSGSTRWVGNNSGWQSQSTTTGGYSFARRYDSTVNTYLTGNTVFPN